jgi:hypothetical protein
VATSHLGVHLLDGAVDGDVTVLLVHRVSASARIVLDQNGEVLDGVRVLLKDLIRLTTNEE